ncbi:substrate-binding and GGDEF domain-containing protein [Butyrivibrio sp. WCE2006]|uniref:substrate-binding and GGDEF domain-containing protein n=1 Tax=Butyrivibrio sp. WCE2006 TaxID=1410611 RepID=UPI0005D2B0D2|nr:GGDEF domain-containing protein [Butyrivibrio sp. WCE2006]
MINGKKIIALCTSRIYDTQNFGFIESLGKALKSINYRLFIYALNSDLYWVDNDVHNETYVFDLIPYDKIEAVIIMDEKIKSTDVAKRIIANAQKHSVPAIIIDGSYEGTTQIHFAYSEGFEKVVRHIIEHHKVKNPHFMAGYKDNKFSDERIEVFKKVLHENGRTFNDSMISYGDFWADPSRQATRELLKRETIPDAIICANDIMAINVCDVLISSGLSVPDDVIVSGFDGLEEAFIFHPGITTASCDNVDLSETVCKALRYLENNTDPKNYYVTPKFIQNESCGCPKNITYKNSIVTKLNDRFYRYQDDIRVLHDITTKLFSAKAEELCVSSIRTSLTQNMCCIINNACFSHDKNFFLDDINDTNFSIVYNSYSEEDKITPYDNSKIIPNLDEILNKGYPLIFNCMDYMNKPIGFICYSFEKYDIVEYTKTPSITDAISMGIGGYVNLQYQHFLMNKVQEMYKNDALTGFFNRLAFQSAFDELKSIPGAVGKPLTIIMQDLDKLKIINDSYGHTEGDKAISTAARALKDACPENTLLVRFGGDEMLALISGLSNNAEIIHNIQNTLKEESRKLGYNVSVSIGTYTTILTKDLNLDQIIVLADQQMYKMKKNNEGIF